ncbi:MAG: hypothetical protein OSB20_10805, partial [Porticoccaceae bacterium]|nr:hypothetical protein [Porticoccaceae bacterium]
MLKTLNIRLRCTLVSIVMTLLVMTALVVWFWSGIEYLPAVEMSLYAKDRVTAPAIDTSISPRLGCRTIGRLLFVFFPPQ